MNADAQLLDYAQTFLLAMLIVYLVARQADAEAALDIHSNGIFIFVFLLVFYAIITAIVIAVGAGLYFGGDWLIRLYSQQS